MAEVSCSYVVAKVSMSFDYWDMLHIVDALVEKADHAEQGGYDGTAKANRELAKDILKAYMAELNGKTPSYRLEQVENKLANAAS
jgi:hypothetical protein